MREFRVIVSRAPAEFGGRVGGIVNVVTKGGSNLFSGEVFEQFRDKSMNRVDKFQQALHDETGAPITRLPPGPARLLVRRAARQGHAALLHVVRAQGQPRVLHGQHGPAPVLLGARGHLPRRVARQLDLRQGRSAGHAVAALVPALLQPGPDLLRGWLGRHQRGLQRRRRHRAGVLAYPGAQLGAVPRVLNEFTVMMPNRLQDTLLNDRYTPAAYAQAGSARFNFPSLSWGNSPGTHFRNVYQQFRGSGDAHHRPARVEGRGRSAGDSDLHAQPGQPAGHVDVRHGPVLQPGRSAFNFNSLTGPTQFQATVPAYSPENLSHTFEAFVQDQWRARDNVTVNLGLRYDLQQRVWHEDYQQSRYPRPLPYVDFASRGDNNNVAPRVGLAWDLFSTGRSVVRAGYGVVYTNAQNSLLDGETNALPDEHDQHPQPRLPRPVSGPESAGVRVHGAAEHHDRRQRPGECSRADMERRALARPRARPRAARGRRLHRGIDDIPTNIQINQPDPVTGPGALPEWGRISQTQPIGSTGHKALLARLDKRLDEAHAAHGVAHAVEAGSAHDRHEPSRSRPGPRAGRHRSPPQPRGERRGPRAGRRHARRDLDGPFGHAVHGRWRDAISTTTPPTPTSCRAPRGTKATGTSTSRS